MFANRVLAPVGGGVLADPTTSLLLHFDGANGDTTFTDSSMYGLTPTLTGNAALTTTSPKFGTASLDTGSAGYLSYSANSVLQFGTGKFTAECFVNITDRNNNQGVFDFGYTTGVLLYFNGPANGYDLYVAGSGVSNAIPTFVAGAWAHVVVQRDETNLSVYHNGTRTYYAANSANLTANVLRIGNAFHTNIYFNSKIDELRIKKGVAVYSGVTITPPAAPFTS